MRLALALGRANVDEMLRELSAAQFSEWFAFYSLEPWGFMEENRRMSVLASTVANVAGKTLRKPASLADFMPAEPQTPQQQQRALVAKARAIFGG